MEFEKGNKMNKQEADILLECYRNPGANQRELSELTGWSLGIVNRSLKTLAKEGFLDDKAHVFEKGLAAIRENSPKKAVILAAGFGMRMVPINYTTPKALITVKGEKLIERLIRQLHEVGITDISVVVGFMKDQFEYLIDTYGVKLLVNPDYSVKNNLHSVAIYAGAGKKRAGTIGGKKAGDASESGNFYVVPCDLWCEKNPFSREELYSWYMMDEEEDPDSGVRVNRKDEVVRCKTGENGQRMIGISYLTKEDWRWLREELISMDGNHRYDDFFWEEALFAGGQDRMQISSRRAEGYGIVEINTYEQLRNLDAGSDHLASEAIRVIADHFHVNEHSVTDITMLKKGMTNRSFLFRIGGEKYIMRIPGEGTELLINRREEAEVFQAISGKGFCDDPELILPDKGYKITRYLEGVRTCDAEDEEELRKCMALLRKLHDMRLSVDHTFDIFGQIDFYEGLWEGDPSIYPDYAETKQKVLELKAFIESQPKDWCLTHIDANCDNFLFYIENGEEKLQLTDWEYAGMQDPHVDIAMFGIYSLYEKEDMDRLIEIYFGGPAEPAVRAKIYCYVAACGLLWSNWCEYKRKFGVEFGEYSLRQYRYAKEYYRYAKELIEN